VYRGGTKLIELPHKGQEGFKVIDMKKLNVTLNGHSAIVVLNVSSARIKAEGFDIYIEPGHEDCYDTADGRSVWFYEPTYIEGDENAPKWLQDIVYTIDMALYNRKYGLLVA
jgi:hypothetical protein